MEPPQRKKEKKGKNFGLKLASPGKNRKKSEKIFQITGRNPSCNQAQT